MKRPMAYTGRGAQRCQQRDRRRAHWTDEPETNETPNGEQTGPPNEGKPRVRASQRTVRDSRGTLGAHECGGDGRPMHFRCTADMTIATLFFISSEAYLN